MNPTTCVPKKEQESAANHSDSRSIVHHRPVDPMNHFLHKRPPHPDQQTARDPQPHVCLNQSPIDPQADLPASHLKYGSSLREQPDSTVLEYISSTGSACPPAADVPPYVTAMMDPMAVSMTERRDRSFEGKGSSSVSVLRPHSTPATLVWLEENYETADGVCIPRSALYMHYVDFCSRNSIQPVNAASFGKIIRQQFPQLTTRRLGTRGQSRYHYYGIAVRESSIYFQLQYSRKSGPSYDSSGVLHHEVESTTPTVNSSPPPLLHHKSQANVHNSRGVPGPGIMYNHPSTSSNMIGAENITGRQRSLLPDFPSGKNFPFASSVDHTMMETFLVMYKTHCQRILDSVIRANFEEVQTLLVHFWQGIPSHLHPLITSNAFVNLVCACDIILYKSITSFMFTSMTNCSIPENLSRVLRKFSSVFESWVTQSLAEKPERLRFAKVDLAKRFANLIRRQLSIARLSSAVRMITNNTDLLMQMFVDWHSIDYESLINETTACHMSYRNSSPDYAISEGDSTSFRSQAGPYETSDQTLSLVKSQVMRSGCEEFVRLLEQEPPLESFLQWLHSLAHKCVIYTPGRTQITCRADLSRNARSFLSLWSGFVARIMRNLTLNSASSFGSFHLMRLLFDDYILYLIENLHMDSLVGEFLMHMSSDRTLALEPSDSFFPDAAGFNTFVASEESQQSVDDLPVSAATVTMSYSPISYTQSSGHIHLTGSSSSAHYSAPVEEYYQSEADSSSFCWHEEYQRYYSDHESRVTHPHWTTSGSKREDVDHGNTALVPGHCYSSPHPQDHRYSQYAYSS